MSATDNPLVIFSVADIMFSMSRATAEQLQEAINTFSGHSKYLGSTSALSFAAEPLGVPAFDQSLPDYGLPRGQVTEVSVASAAGLATTVGLWACRAAQKQSPDAWCAFIDPSHSLFAPGVRSTGVDLERLLVVRPPAEAVDRVAVKLAEAHVFSVIVIDAVVADWTAQDGAALDLTRWSRSVRRLAMAVSTTATRVVLLTNQAARRALPLPVALRLELQRQSDERLRVVVAKDKRGRIQPPRVISLVTAPSTTTRTDTLATDTPATDTPATNMMDASTSVGPSTASTPVASASDMPKAVVGKANGERERAAGLEQAPASSGHLRVVQQVAAS